MTPLPVRLYALPPVTRSSRINIVQKRDGRAKFRTSLRDRVTNALHLPRS